MTHAATYEQAYTAWQRDPHAWWAEAAEGITWDRRWDAVFDPATGPYGRWFPGARMNTCLQLPGPPRGRRARRADGADLGQRHDQPDRALHLRPAAAPAPRRWPARWRQLGVRAGDRVVIYMPMVPEAAIAMLACARLGAIHSVVFGGFAAAELASRIADARPKVIVSASCGLEPGRVVQYKPLLDAAIALSPHKPDACLILQREQAQAKMQPGRDHDLPRSRSRRRAARLRAGRGDRSAVYPLHLRHDRAAEGHPARQRRPRGRAVELHAHDLRPGRRRRVLDRVGCRLGGRPQLHRLCAAAARLHQRDVRGQAGRHAGCRRVLAGLRAARPARAVHRAHRDPRHQAAGPGGQAAAPARPVEAGGAVPRRRALRPAHRHLGHRTARQAGGGPLVADRNRLADHRPASAQYGLFPFKPGSGGRPSPGYDLHAAGRRGARCCRAARAATCRCACRCRPAARRRCGRTTRATTPPTCPTSPAGTAPATPAWWTRTATSG